MVKALVKLNLKEIFIFIPIMAICQLYILGIVPEEKSYLHFILVSLIGVGFLQSALKTKNIDFFNILPVTREEILKSRIITLFLGYIMQLIVYGLSLALGYKFPNIFMVILISIIVSFYSIVCIYSMYIEINKTLECFILYVPCITFLVLLSDLFEKYIAFQMHIVFSLAVLSLIGIFIFKKYFYKKLIGSAIIGDVK